MIERKETLAINQPKMQWNTTDIIYVSSEAINGFVSIIGNSVVLIAIIKTHQLHTVTNVFVGNLAMADILVGLLVAPLAAMTFLGIPADVYGCIFINCAILMFTNVSILMLLAVAVERFIAIRLPFEYNRLLTIKRALWFNAGIWLVGSLIGLMPMFGWNKAPPSLDRCAFINVISYEYMVYFQFFVMIIIPILIMLLIYAYIFCVIRKHTKKTDTLQNLFNTDQRTKHQWKKDVRAAKSFALIIVLFAIFWLPVNILNCLSLFYKSLKTPLELLLAAIVMSHANSSINPFLYAASNSRILSSVKALLGIKNSRDELISMDFPSMRSAPPNTRQAVTDLEQNKSRVNISTILTENNCSDNHLKANDQNHYTHKDNIGEESSIKLQSLPEILKSSASLTSKEEAKQVDTASLSVKSLRGSLEVRFRDITPSSNGHTSAGSNPCQNGLVGDPTSKKSSFRSSPSLTPPREVKGHVNLAFINDSSPDSTHESSLVSESKLNDNDANVDHPSNCMDHSATKPGDRNLFQVYSSVKNQDDNLSINADTTTNVDVFQNVQDSPEAREDVDRLFIKHPIIEYYHPNSHESTSELFDMDDEPMPCNDDWDRVVSMNDEKNGDSSVQDGDKDKKTSNARRTGRKMSCVHHFDSNDDKENKENEVSLSKDRNMSLSSHIKINNSDRKSDDTELTDVNIVRTSRGSFGNELYITKL